MGVGVEAAQAPGASGQLGSLRDDQMPPIESSVPTGVDDLVRMSAVRRYGVGGRGENRISVLNRPHLCRM